MEAVSRSFIWVNTKMIIADILTKESAPIELIKEVLKTGLENNQSSRREESWERLTTMEIVLYPTCHFTNLPNPSGD